MTKKLNGWYSDQIVQQLKGGKVLEEVDVNIRLSTFMTLHTGWIVDIYNYMTSADGKEVINNGIRDS